jgi:hypothetical protein
MPRTWSDEQLRILVNLYPRSPQKLIKTMLKEHSWMGIVTKASELGVKRTRMPKGYCQCGCGQKTRLAPKTSKAKGQKKGEPLRFIKGHNGRGCNNPHYNMGLTFSKGYWQVTRRDMSTVPFSHVVMEFQLRRCLGSGEVVHHKNEITTDDSPGNLELASSNSEHKHLFHNKHTNQELIQKLKQFIEATRKIPTSKEITKADCLPGFHVYRYHFGTFQNVLNEVGYGDKLYRKGQARKLSVS